MAAFTPLPLWSARHEKQPATNHGVPRAPNSPNSPSLLKPTKTARYCTQLVSLQHAHITSMYARTQIIFAVLEHRLSYPPPKWRNVYKALVVIEYLVKRGSDDCLRLGTDIALVTHVRELSAFQFTDPDDGRDYGINVRKKSETLSILLEDGPRLAQEREEYATKARRYAGYSRDDMLQGASFKTATPSTGWGAARAGSDIADDECVPSSPTPTQRCAASCVSVYVGWLLHGSPPQQCW